MKIILFILLFIFSTARADVKTHQQMADEFYKEQKYSEACSEYEKATKEGNAQANIWSDLGLCLMKLGKTKQAKEASFEAVNRGGTATRLNAYFNLWKLGVKNALPLFHDHVNKELCTKWKSNIGDTSKSVEVCTYDETCMGGTGVDIDQRGVTVCPEGTKEAAVNRCGRREPKSCFTVELKEEEISHCRPQDFCTDDANFESKKCEKKTKACQKHDTRVTSRSCIFVSIDNREDKFRVGAVCDGKAVEFTSGEKFFDSF
jgi:hypothetical protein